MPTAQKAKPIEPLVRISVTDQAFQELYSRVLSLDLPPGTKMSEAEMSKQMGVSRQVIRDAFYRLSTLGFLLIRPQKATVVSHISSRDVFEARYIRTAIEVENVRQACTNMSDAQLSELEGILAEQSIAIAQDEHQLFHTLDNKFHKKICEFAGIEFAWSAIQERKAHTDRVRYLSISFASQQALDGHYEILKAMKARDIEKASQAMRSHLSQIEQAIAQLKETNHEWFEDES